MTCVQTRVWVIARAAQLYTLTDRAFVSTRNSRIRGNSEALTATPECTEQTLFLSVCAPCTLSP